MLIKYEMKRVLKNKALAIIMIMFILVSLMYIKDLGDRSKSVRENSELYISSYDNINKLSVRDEIETYKYNYERYKNPEDLEFSEIVEERVANSNKAIAYKESGDYQSAYKYEIKNQIMFLLTGAKRSEKNKARKDIELMWEDIGDGEAIPKYPRMRKEESLVLVQNAIYSKSLYEHFNKDIKYSTKDTANQLVFLYNIMDKLIPIFLIFMILILSSDAISEEHRLNISRNILSQPMERFDYFKKLLFSNYITIIIIFLLAIFVMTLLAGFLTDFTSFKSPTLTTDNQWNSLKIPGMKLNAEDDMYKYSFYKGDVYIGPVPIDSGWGLLNIYKTIKFTPFINLLIFYVFEMLLFGFFLGSLVIFVSSLTDKKGISMAISIALLLVLFFIKLKFPSLPNPLMALDTRYIMSGAKKISLLGLTIIQLISILFNLLVAKLVFKRLEIVY